MYWLAEKYYKRDLPEKNIQVIFSNPDFLICYIQDMLNVVIKRRLLNCVIPSIFDIAKKKINNFFSMRIFFIYTKKQNSERVKKFNIFSCNFSHWDERGKACGHEPPLFPLLCHILAFLFSGSHKPQPLCLLSHNIWVFGNVYVFLL